MKNNIWRILHQNLSLTKQGNLICPFVSIIDIMRCHTNGNTIFCHFIHNMIDHRCMLWIQCCSRLIQNNNFRMHDQNICNGYLFFLSSTQGMGRFMPKRRDFQMVNHFFDFLLCLLFRNSKIQYAKRNLLIYTGRKQLIIRILKNNPYFASEIQKSLLIIPVRLSLIIQSSLLGFENPHTAEEKCGFSGTIGTHKCDFSASFDFKRQSIQRMCIFIIIGIIQILRF